jgi:hypothetical protein
MISQLLFAEGVEVVSEDGDFVHVVCRYDGYRGWCQRTQLWPADEHQVAASVAFCGAFHTGVELNGENANVPFASPLPGWSDAEFGIGRNRVIYNRRTEDVLEVPQIPTFAHLRAFAMMYLNTGYLWGGKSVYGTDCSGFVQQVFKLCGIRLPRDAYQQAEEGVHVNTVDDAVRGDLAFFHNEGGRVTHVGIVLDDKQIIHASGRVRIDRLTADGIVTGEGKETHQLHSIRRYHGCVRDDLPGSRSN